MMHIPINHSPLKAYFLICLNIRIYLERQKSMTVGARAIIGPYAGTEIKILEYDIFTIGSLIHAHIFFMTSLLGG